MSLVIRGEYPSNVFQLLGNDENSATYALGWTLERCPVFLNAFASQIVGRQLEPSDGLIVLQKSGNDGGTDLEIHYGKEFHCIVEAKQGWVLPTLTLLPSSVFTVSLFCCVKTYTPVPLVGFEGADDVLPCPPARRWRQPPMVSYWGILKWPSLGEFGWPPGVRSFLGRAALFKRLCYSDLILTI